MATETKTYNGWSNWSTWNANLWLTNDEYTYNRLIKCKSLHDVRLLWQNFFEGQDGIKTSAINFREIFESLKD